MPRQLLYDFMSYQSIESSLFDFLSLNDCKFNKQIGFDCCYDIQKVIRDGVLNLEHHIEVDNCDFIDAIDISYVSTKDNENLYDEDSLFTDKSELISYEYKTATIKLITYDWSWNRMGYMYSILKYTLYIVYYIYLKNTNPTHEFVRFVELLPRLDFYNPTPTSDKPIEIKEYIDSLKEIDTKPINEDLFLEVVHIYFDIKSNNSKFKKGIALTNHYSNLI